MYINNKIITCFMSYTIEEKNLERQHLLAEFLAPISAHALNNIVLPEAATILDLGCGLGDTSLMLSIHFPNSSVTGLDQDASLIDAARTMNKNKNAALQFQEGNALKLPFPDNSFDFVFTRYLLHHIKDSLSVLEEMKRVCKPGGIVFAQEPDLHFLQSYPESWAYPQMKEFTNILFADALLGRKLLSYFGLLQLKEIGQHAEVIFGANTAKKRFLTLTAEAQRTAVLQNKIITEKKLNELIEECRRLENDPQTIILTFPTIAVWGIKN
jgi:ubiquinone/menaquinone biosynthesis C-methylase UbiE